MDISGHNRRQIVMTNQRGRRLLSIVDLIEAGTISIEAGAFCWTAIEAGSSFFTGAVPGGAGKTTLMSALMNFLPPEELILTVTGKDVIEKAVSSGIDQKFCLLAHEVGSGSYYGYIWNETAGAFLKAAESGIRIVTTLHADTPRQVEDTFKKCGLELRHPPATLQLFIKRLKFGTARRVTSIYVESGGKMDPLFIWNDKNDHLEPSENIDTMTNKAANSLRITPDEFRIKWSERKHALADMCRHGTNDFRAVRKATVEYMNTRHIS